MYCPYCRCEIRAGESRCRHCGAPVPADGAQGEAAGSVPDRIWGDRAEKKKKPLLKRWWFWFMLLLALILACGAYYFLSGRTAYNSLEDQYTLGAGYFETGADIPAGVCDITVLSGSGSLSYSDADNEEAISELLGRDDGSGFYTEALQDVKLPRGATVSINGTLSVRLAYTDIDSAVGGRSYDESRAVTLEGGDYVAGTDFSPGLYRIKALAGTGNISSSNVNDGGVNEAFGIDDGSGIFTGEVMNVNLPDQVVLRISQGLTVQLLPALSNAE